MEKWCCFPDCERWWQQKWFTTLLCVHFCYGAHSKYIICSFIRSTNIYRPLLYNKCLQTFVTVLTCTCLTLTITVHEGTGSGSWGHWILCACLLGEWKGGAPGVQHWDGLQRWGQEACILGSITPPRTECSFDLGACAHLPSAARHWRITGDWTQGTSSPVGRSPFVYSVSLKSLEKGLRSQLWGA